MRCYCPSAVVRVTERVESAISQDQRFRALQSFEYDCLLKKSVQSLLAAYEGYLRLDNLRARC